MKDYPHILAKIKDTPWLIIPESLGTILSIVDRRMNDDKLTDEELSIILRENTSSGRRTRSRADSSGGVGLIPLYGSIFPKANMMTEMSGATSIESFREDFRMLMNNDMVGTIVMDIDSPGGMSDLIMEMGDEIRASRDVKPIYAVANTTAGSAAYWLGSQATKFYSTPSGMVGSVGAVTVHEDHSVADANAGIKTTYISAGRFKVEGNPHSPLSEEGRAYRQEIIDKLRDQFVTNVAAGRGIDKEKVISDFGEGRMYTAEKATEVGMIDGIASLDDVVSNLLSQSTQLTGAMAAQRVSMSMSRFKLEHAPEEHSEPGQGGEIVPVYPPTEKDVKEGWRRDTPPYPTDVLPENQTKDGGNSMNPLLRAYAEALGITVSDGMVDADLRSAIAAKVGFNTYTATDTDEQFMAGLATHTAQLNDEIAPLREVNSRVSKQRAFAEQYPEEAARMSRLEANEDKRQIEAFVEQVSRVRTPEGVVTKFSLSTIAQDTARAFYTNLRANSATSDDLAELINLVASPAGTLELNTERGSSRQAELTEQELGDGTVRGTRMLFAAKVEEVMKEDNLDYGTAVKLAAEKYPDLAEAYHSAHNQK